MPLRGDGLVAFRPGERQPKAYDQVTDLTSERPQRWHILRWFRMKLLWSLLIPCLVLPPGATGAEMKPLAAADRTAVAEGNNVFAVALYGRLRNQGGNLFFSPESISTALAMAYSG